MAAVRRHPVQDQRGELVVHSLHDGAVRGALASVEDVAEFQTSSLAREQVLAEALVQVGEQMVDSVQTCRTRVELSLVFRRDRRLGPYRCLLVE